MMTIIYVLLTRDWKRDFNDHPSSLFLHVSCSPFISERLSWESAARVPHTSYERPNRWANTLITQPALLRLPVYECFSVPHALLRKHYVYLFSVLLLSDLEPYAGVIYLAFYFTAQNEHSCTIYMQVLISCRPLSTYIHIYKITMLP